MKNELDEQLCRDFPHLFGDRHASMMNSCFAFGFECNDGWEPLLRRTAQKLEPLIVKYIDEKIKENDTDTLKFGFPRAAQVKEKYGSLRFYMTSETEEMSKIIEEAEKESEITCEECGAPGEIRGGGWLYCRCDSCWKKLQEDRYGI